MYKSKRIRLRPIEENDAPMIMEMRADMKDIRSYVGRPFPNNEEGEKDWIMSLYHKGLLSNIVLGIEDAISGKLAGIIAARNIDYINRNAIIGTFVHKDFRSKGYFREAQILFFAYLFNEINLHKITTEVISYHEVSLRVLTSMGFVEDGIRREQVFQNGNYYDLVMLSLFPEVFFKVNDIKCIV